MKSLSVWPLKDLVQYVFRTGELYDPGITAGYIPAPFGADGSEKTNLFDIT